MKKLMVLDGNSIINRAFYGIRLLTNSEGLYTNAIYGFVNILLKYTQEEKPDYICVAFDVAAPTFRHEKYDKYKAQRKKMPEELAVQMPVLKEVLSAMNINMLTCEGYEADDIIGTVAKCCENEDISCVILTGDKDDLQLATDKTKIKLITTRGGNTLTTDYYAQDVKEQYGITPDEFIDLKGLMGDPSDNIPGVPGIGEKTAAELIKSFGSIEFIYDNIDKINIKDSVRKKLIEGKESAYLSKHLSKIDKNVPIDFCINDCATSSYDKHRLASIFRRLNFSSLIQRLNLNEQPRQIEFNTAAAGDAGAIKKKIIEAKTMYYYFGEREIAVASCENDITVIEKNGADFSDLFADDTVKKIGHDIKKDLENGININNIYFDTFIASYIISPSRSSYDISSLASEYLGIDTMGETQNILAAIISMHRYLDEKITEYGQSRLFYEIEMPLVTVLAEMQKTGISVNSKKLGEFSQMLQERANLLTEKIYAHAKCEFNINSSKQLSEVLFERLGLPVIKKTKTGYSTDIDVLEKLKGSHEIIDLIMEYRHVIKLKSTYADGLLAVINPDTGRIHTSFNQTVTVTGRISSTEPNLQNIPVRTELGRQFRKVFQAESDDYILVDSDYSQIELRVLAHISNDENMINAFLNDADIHTQTASRVFKVAPDEVTDEMRTRAKAVNFGIVYGIGDFSLSRDLGVTRAQARKYIEDYLDTFPGVRDYMKNIVMQGRENGYVTTLLNRRRYIPELKTGNFVTRSYGERIALNTPIQGSAADIIKIAMVKVYNRLKSEAARSRLILQVHDELIVEAHKDEMQRVKEILRSEMEQAYKLKVPLRADISTGKTWFDAK
jgi:DNA polymerase-1